MKHFNIDNKYADLLAAVGISTEEVLKKAMLPEDLFSRKNTAVSDEQYYRFMEAIDELSSSNQIPIQLATFENIETFSPLVFAVYCSKNAVTAIKRLVQYKALIGSVVFQVEESTDTIGLVIMPENEQLELPEILIGIEMVFLVNLIQKATKKEIIPIHVTVRNKMKNNVYQEFLKADFEIGIKNKIVFKKEDALVPFISRNDNMWNYFEPELKRRLSEMKVEDAFSTRVRSALIELLPSGECTLKAVCNKLGYSRRTIQRRLLEENTTFQKQLNQTRELLAKHYLLNSDMNTEDIAYLLCYQSMNSFYRAFKLWTGMNISEYRNNNKRYDLS